MKWPFSAATQGKATSPLLRLEEAQESADPGWVQRRRGGLGQWGASSPADCPVGDLRVSTSKVGLWLPLTRDNAMAGGTNVAMIGWSCRSVPTPGEDSIADYGVIGGDGRKTMIMRGL